MKPITRYFAFLFFMFISQQILIVLINDFLRDFNLTFTIAKIVSFLITFLLIYKLKWLRFIHFSTPNWQKLTLYSCLYLLLGILFHYLYQDDLIFLNTQQKLHELLRILILTPIIEEILFRGIATEYLEEKGINKNNRILFTTICFGLVHAPFYNFVDIQFFIIGFVCAVIYEKERNLAYIIIGHSIINLMLV